MTRAQLSIGIAGALDRNVAVRLAPRIEQAGFHALWVNDTPEGDSLATLAAVAEVTTTLRLATGVIPVDRRSLDEIRHAADSLPRERIVLGIGAGQLRAGALAQVAGVATGLRDDGYTVLVGALGPAMRRLGAQQADGSLLSWLTPGIAALLSAEAQSNALSVARHTHTALYVRTALDPAAEERLAAEEASYAAKRAYAANFARLGIAVGDTVIRPGTAAERAAAFAASVDEVVFRAIAATDDVGSYVAFVEALASII
jgi:alkanesulfonate monooxygenase SsuD/methylene tetrahydromethanopterin reductase-like flavin-dependent oxidoreductase (luciferase family)